MKTLTGHDGLPLHWREWGADLSLPTRGTVLIVHGLGEHIGRYEAVAGRLNDWGWHAAGYDQRGHGASGGPRGDIPAHDSLLRDLAAAIDGLRADERKGRGPLILLGHSMGGAVAARFVAGALEQAPWSRPVDVRAATRPMARRIAVRGPNRATSDGRGGGVAEVGVMRSPWQTRVRGPRRGRRRSGR